MEAVLLLLHFFTSYVFTLARAPQKNVSGLLAHASSVWFLESESLHLQGLSLNWKLDFCAVPGDLPTAKNYSEVCGDAGEYRSWVDWRRKVFFSRLAIAATVGCMKPEKEAQPTGSGEGPQMN